MESVKEQTSMRVSTHSSRTCSRSSARITQRCGRCSWRSKKSPRKPWQFPQLRRQQECSVRVTNRSAAAEAAKVQTQQNPRPCRTHFARSEVQEVPDRREEEGGVGWAHASPKLGGGHRPCRKSANKGRPMSPSEPAAKLKKNERQRTRSWTMLVGGGNRNLGVAEYRGVPVSNSGTRRTSRGRRTASTN